VFGGTCDRVTGSGKPFVTPCERMQCANSWAALWPAPTPDPPPEPDPHAASAATQATQATAAGPTRHADKRIGDLYATADNTGVTAPAPPPSAEMAQVELRDTERPQHL